MFFCCDLALALLLLEGFHASAWIDVVCWYTPEDCQGEHFRQHTQSPVRLTRDMVIGVVECNDIGTIRNDHLSATNFFVMNKSIAR